MVRVALSVIVMMQKVIMVVKNVTLYYSIPWRNYLLTLSGSKYSYHQTVAGAFESYVYSGESQQMKVNLSRLLSRGSQHKTYINGALWTKKIS